MHKRIKAILGTVLFALLLTTAVFAYNTLTETFQPEPPPALASQAAQDNGVIDAGDSVGVGVGDSMDNGAGDGASGDAHDAYDTDKPVAAPDFTAYGDDGATVKLSGYIGKPVVLNFWASWCPPCKSEMPHFNSVYEEVKEDVIFLMVNLTDGVLETEENGRQYITENGYTFPVLYDKDQEAAYAYGIRSIPSTVFIDEDGTIAAGVVGAISEETLRLGIGILFQ